MNEHDYRNEIRRKLRASGVPEDTLEEDVDAVIRHTRCALSPAEIQRLDEIQSELQFISMKLQRAHNQSSSGTPKNDMQNYLLLTGLVKQVRMIRDFYTHEMRGDV